jgi:hypothetical protein
MPHAGKAFFRSTDSAQALILTSPFAKGGKSHCGCLRVLLTLCLKHSASWVIGLRPQFHLELLFFARAWPSKMTGTH